ncbi:GNAT family N-acetyltransferase [Stappia sp. 28M-7]|uniref:GNAT family N-acetyltransferase n=1 Tax=Stappia sp. 28M-7 TaxID=2762596 RepID=UPI00163BCA8D|nr:GNAT family N-acetyltransferase [Stappia sp. 28M-7]MBC2860661.1 GNAT family N-acetyltransferase [Stappia sp. 28M-7]
MTSSITVDLSGYTDLPAGKVATIVTYLEMHARPLPRRAERPDLSLERIEHPDPTEYRALFRRIGDEWLWFGRLTGSDADLVADLTRPGHEVYFCRKGRGGEPVGLLELDFGDPANVELAYFGLVAEEIGNGAGRWLMNEALSRVWSRPQTRRLFVHTCTADSPQALGFYRASGFTPYKRAIEIADDPRLAGVLPREAAGHVPVIEGE